MPAFLADIIGNQFVETNHDFKFALAGDDAERVAQAFFQGKLLRTDERFPGQLRLLNPGGDKSANVISQMTIREEKPLAVDVGQVIWVDDARFRFLSARLAISQKQLPMSRGGFGQGVENFHVQNRLGAGAKGDGLLPVSEVQGHGVWERRGHFLERAQERPLERRAAVLLQRLFRHEQREQFAFGDLQRWKITDFFCVMEAAARAIKFNRQLQPVAHELNVAINRLGADFQLAGQCSGVGIFAGVDRLMNAKHPFQRRTR